MRLPRNRFWKRHNIGFCRSGVVSVEMAICLPVLFLLLFGCYEVAHANMLHHAAENAAYEAARIGIVPGATAARCENQASAVLRSMGIRQFTVNVTPGNIGRRTGSVTVRIDVPLSGNSIIAPMFFGSVIFHGDCEMIREVL